MGTYVERYSYDEADNILSLQHRGSDPSHPGWTRTYAYDEASQIEPGKRSGKPCIRGLRMTVQDVLEYLAAGMTVDEILADFPDLTAEDIRACLAFAADRERRLPWEERAVRAPVHASDERALEVEALGREPTGRCAPRSGRCARVAARLRNRERAR